MRELILSQTAGDLRSGGALSPQMERNMLEGFRSSEAARGFTTGRGSSNRESVKRALEQQHNLEKKQNRAMQVSDWERSSRPDPFLSVLGRSASAQNAGQQLQQTSGAGSQSAGAAPGADFFASNYWNANSGGGGGGGNPLADRAQALGEFMAISDPNLPSTMRNYWVQNYGMPGGSPTPVAQ